MDAHLPETIKSILDTTIQLIGADRAFLMLGDAGGEFFIVAAQNWKFETLKPSECEINHSVVNLTIQQGEVVLITDAGKDTPYGEQKGSIPHSPHSIICVPLLVKEDPIGVIYADKRVHEGVFSERDEELLSVFTIQAAAELDNALLIDEMSISNHQTIEAMDSALDLRDSKIGGHARRYVLYSMALADTLGLPEDQLLDLRLGALMHDIGKLGVPDAILLKPGPLTEEEWVLMRRHPENGAHLLEGNPLYKRAIEIIRAHHERWDGNGYPCGLKGEEIPLGARILAVANAFDVMTSEQTYRATLTPDDAYLEILNNAGSQFDPAVVEAFNKCWESGEIQLILKGGQGP